MDLYTKFEEHLRRRLLQVDTFHPFYQEALNYTLQAPAKRFRPLLLLTIVEAKEPLLLPSALDVALALELFHTYSLIHDDLPIMDDATLRRGRPTLHRAFDEVTAVLVGDGLNTHAFLLIAEASLHPDVRVALVRELAQAGGIGGMVHGQILDCHFEEHPLSLQELRQLHLNKTAKLIAASLKMGAIIANLPPHLQEELFAFGLELGLLFQIQDDLIDALAHEEEVGKTTRNDGKKNSFTQLLGVKGALEEADRLAQKLERELKAMEEPIAQGLGGLLGNYLYRHNDLKGRHG
ncbi:MAG: geranyl transferase [Nitratiruptor sp.]|nr:geranyl transferase [Nitratiruptor sp.]NPA83564.1 polyprenyl synthetase family protein [Campylobacterota bacterium]